MKEYAIAELDIPDRVACHIWDRHRIYGWQVCDVVDDPNTRKDEKTDRKHGRVLIARGRDRGGTPLILYMSFVDERQGLYRLRTARRPDENEYRRFFK
ncbi:MAG: hypothetical protein SWK76_00275 [Actinomycetota bacterium]|nr:hypothetical protein [Actinomycetota bacterium]